MTTTLPTPTILRCHALRCTEHDSPLYLSEAHGVHLIGQPETVDMVACSKGCVFPATELGGVAEHFITDAANRLYVQPAAAPLTGTKQ